MKKLIQSVLYCPCGKTKIFAYALCASCYSLKRQDTENFDGLRERVLERDGYRYRVCAELPEVERLYIGQSPSVHHRVPGVLKLHLMITLCAAHHAQVGRLRVARKRLSPLLLMLWREQHPDGREQTLLDFRIKKEASTPVPLFATSKQLEQPSEVNSSTSTGVRALAGTSAANIEQGGKSTATLATKREKRIEDLICRVGRPVPQKDTA